MSPGTTRSISTDERVHNDLEHVREHVLFRVGIGAEFFRRVAFALDEQRGVAFERRGQQLLEDLEQLGDAGAVARRHKAHGNQVTVAQRLFERRVQLLRRKLLALLQVLRHQRLVDLDDLVDQRLVRLRDRREIGISRRVEEAVDDPRAVARRQVDRQTFLAERCLQRFEHAFGIDVVGVDLVDDDQTAEPSLAGPFHHPLRDHLDAGLCVDDDARRFDSIERTDRLAHEVRKPRRVDQVDARPLGVQVRYRRAQRVFPCLLERVEVAHGRAALDAARGANRACLCEQRLR